MFEINTTDGYFLHLLRAGLMGAAPKPKPDNVDFSEVFKLAKLHRVDDVVFASVSQLEHKPDFYEKWHKRHCMAVARSATQLYEYAQICTALTAVGAQILPYKGIVLKGYYPEASMRYMTDIDMMYTAPNGDHTQIKHAMESLGYTAEQFDSGVHDTYHKPPLMSVELHRVIFSPDADGFLSNADYMAAAAPDEQGVMVLPLPYLYFASLTHLIKHLRKDSTDLRSVMDLYLLRRSMTDEQIRQADECIRRAGVFETDRVICAIARAVFENETPDQRTQACIEYLLRSPADRKSADAKYLNTYKRGNSVGLAKLRYYLHLVLPDYTYMKASYPILGKAPVLLPIWWIVRWADVLLHQRKRAKHALHRFDDIDSDNSDQAKSELELFGLK